MHQQATLSLSAKSCSGKTREVGNIVSENASGELYVTYVFEWHHPGASQEELDTLYVKEKGIAQHSVEGTVDVIRKLVKEGKL